MRHALAELIEAAERYQAYHDQKFYADAVVKPTGLRPAIAKARAAQSAVVALTDDEITRLIATAAQHLRTWATSTNKEPYRNTMEVALRLDALVAQLGSAPQSATARITLERISELWKQAMSEGAQHFVGFINRGLVPNFEHPENLTLPQRFAILLLAEMKA